MKFNDAVNINNSEGSESQATKILSKIGFDEKTVTMYMRLANKAKSDEEIKALAKRMYNNYIIKKNSAEEQYNEDFFSGIIRMI